MQKLAQGILFFLFLLVLTGGNLAFMATSQALHFWFEKLVPSMFVTMVLITLCLEYNVFARIPLISRLFQYLFDLDQGAAGLVLACLFVGAPTGAVLLEQQVKEKKLSLDAAKRLIACLSLATPSFIVVSCGAVFLNSLQLGFILWGIEIACCLFFLFIYRKPRIELSSSPKKPEFFPAFKNAVKNSGISLFYVGGYLMMFLTLFNLITIPLPQNLKPFLKAIGEFSLGCAETASLALPLKLRFPLLAAILGFNGLCVHLQIFSLAQNSRPAYPTFLFLRIIQAFLGFAAGSILFLLLQ